MTGERMGNRRSMSRRGRPLQGVTQGPAPRRSLLNSRGPNLVYSFADARKKGTSSVNHLKTCLVERSSLHVNSQNPALLGRAG